jgi:hypothetical protein
MQKYEVESVELNEDLWRAWVQKGKLRDQRARIRGQWIGGISAVAVAVGVVGFLMFHA